MVHHNIHWHHLLLRYLVHLFAAVGWLALTAQTHVSSLCTDLCTASCSSHVIGQFSGVCHHRSCVLLSGDPTGAEKQAFHSLVWFDHSLRTIGPLFPFMLLATRYRLATLAPEILAYDQQPWVEQVVVYIGLTITRLAIYFIHRLGKHPMSSYSLLHFHTTHYCTCPSMQQRLFLRPSWCRCGM